MDPHLTAEQEENFRNAVQTGLAEADAGIFIEEEEMDVRFRAMMQGASL